MTYPAEVLADSPLVYWRLGEASGTAAADASGNGHPGTYYSGVVLGVPGLLTGDADTAITIAGFATNRRVQSDSPVHAPGTIPTFSMECLVIAASDANGSLILLADPAQVVGDGTTIYATTPSGALGFDFQGTSGFANASAIVTAGVRHHVVGTYDGSRVKLYIDGETVFNEAFVDAGLLLTVADSFGVVTIGTGGSGGGTVTIDEAAFYTHALSPVRVAAHATAAGFSPSPPPFVDSLTPSSGTPAGGTAVVVAGAFLAGATDVAFDGSPASFVVDTDTQLTAIAPAHAAGTVQVVVTSPDGVSG